MRAVERVRFAWIVPSYACNKSCDFCYNGADLLKDKSVASTGTLKRICDLLLQLGVEHCTVLGGEPLIFPHLETLVSSLVAIGTKVTIVSNGLMLARHPERYRWLHEYQLDCIQVSLEPRAPVHSSALTRVADQCLLPILSSSECYVPSSASPHESEDLVEQLDGIELPIKYVVKLFKNSVEGVPALIEAISRSKHRKVLFSFGTAVLSGAYDHQHALLSPRELADYYVQFEEHSRVRGLCPTFYMNLPLCLFPKSFLATVVPESRGVFGCSLLRGDSVVIDHYGHFAQCTHLLPLSEETFLDADAGAESEPVMRSWQTGSAAHVRDELAVARHEACIDCPQFRVKCWGGCPILWSVFDPSDYIGRRTFVPSVAEGAAHL